MKALEKLSHSRYGCVDASPIVLQAGEATIGTLGNFSVSTGEAKAKKTFNVSAIVVVALVNG